MRSKKGDLTNNVLSLIIAVIGIALLGFGIFKLYAVTQDQEYKNAKNLLENVIEKAEALDSGESSDFVFQGFDQSKDWYLVGFGESIDVDKKPEKCFFGSCICICSFHGSGIPGESVPNSAEDYVNMCESEGICESVEFAEIEIGTIEKFDEVFGSGVSKLSCSIIEIPENLISLDIINEDENLEIKHNKDLKVGFTPGGEIGPGRESICYETEQDN